jgi:hypothetical protein
MAKRLLATLKVYESDADCLSGLEVKYRSDTGEVDKNFKLLLCPKGTTGNGLEQRDRVQIMAHELGHFVGHVLGLPAHRESREAGIKAHFAGFDHSYTRMAPAEQEAWNVGEQIVPGAMNSPAYFVSMKGYRGHDAKLEKAIEDLAPEPREYFREFLLGGNR